ncbi:MAG TPA: fatty acyl-AMP ligase [Burkholderiaceae bacterium]|jgi:acyl-CoA synthetase (AMP-forming)/AMP-acid ligase II
MTDNLISRLFASAASHPGKIAFRYLERGEQVGQELSYQELAARVTAIGRSLAAESYRHQRAVLLFAQPLDFIQAFLGCLAAGVTAVPLAVSSLKNLDTLAGICRDADAACVIAGTQERQQLQAALDARTGPLPWHSLEELLAGASAQVDPDSGAAGARIAFLQYTSGSTGAPKGVMVTHANLLANGAAICRGMRMSRDSVFVSWLPHYHDMGLIGNLLQPIYLGASSTLMRPIDFIQKPIRWLRAVSDFGATISGGPNFAFDLCVDKITEEQRAGLDLAKWEVAFTGAEPVKAATVARFAQAFARCGLRAGAIYPCYGMAESTLFITGGHVGTAAPIKHFKADSLTIGKSVAESEPDLPESLPFVSCGQPHGGEQLRIVHPDTHLSLLAGYVGEIWLRGESNAVGYHGHADASERSFGARVIGDSGGAFLRTGDLGTIEDGHLYILGRLKDVLIVRGRNYYPQDIESAAQAAHYALAPNGGAVFQRAVPHDEQLVLVHELTRQGMRDANLEQIGEAVRGAVIAEHGIALAKIVLIKPGQLPRTTSGKVRRNLCREMFERQELLDVGSPEAEEIEP